MTYLAAAVIFLAVLSFLNLALTFAVIRRLRQQTAQPAALRSFTIPSMLQAGASAPEFSATTTSGAARSLSDLTGQRSLIGFFSVRCKSCLAHVPAFVDLARGVLGGPQQVLAVVAGDSQAAVDILALLDGSASIVLEAEDGPVATAFSVWGYPSFYALDERGRIVAGGPTVDSLSAAVSA